MKQLLAGMGIIVLISLILSFFSEPPKHICSDPTHKTCDGYCVCDGLECTGIYNNCPYEGLECPNAQKYARDYQLNIEMDSLEIWDGNRFVGKLSLNSSLDSLILSDNQ